MNQNNNTASTEQYFSRARISMWLGSLSLVIAGVCLMMTDAIDVEIGIVFFLGMICYSMNFFPYIGMQKPYRDERTQKIGTMSATAAWYVTLIATCTILGVLAYSERHLPFTVGGYQVVGLTLIISVVTMLVTNEYYSRKGDVE